MSKCIESRAISWLSRERTKATRSFDNALKRSAPTNDLINLISKNEILEYLLKLSVDAFVSSDIDAEVSFNMLPECFGKPNTPNGYAENDCANCSMLEECVMDAEPNKICPINGAPCNECVPGAYCAKIDEGADR